MQIHQKHDSQYPYNLLEETAKAVCGEVYVVGYAVKAGNALTAIREGYKAALEI